MASGLQISVKDEESARKWLSMVEGINQDYFDAMKDAADCLNGMQEFCEGTLVDDFVKYADQLLTAANKTFSVIKEVATTVNSILSTVREFTEGVVGGISKIAKIFN